MAKKKNQTVGAGRLKFGTRVGAYLANELACYYRMDFYGKHDTDLPAGNYPFLFGVKPS
jgi:hypothetical protein